MKILALALFVGFVSLAIAGGDAAKKIDFTGKIGELPKSWKIGKRSVGDGWGWQWKRDEDKAAPGCVNLAQTKADKKATLNLCIFEGAGYQDLDMTVSFKAVAGEVDEGGGLMWRLRDEGNYYVARMNPIEDN